MSELEPGDRVTTVSGFSGTVYEATPHWCTVLPDADAIYRRFPLWYGNDEVTLVEKGRAHGSV